MLQKEDKAVAFCLRGCLDANERYSIGDEWTVSLVQPQVPSSLHPWSRVQNAWDPSRRFACERVNGRCDIVEISGNRDPLPDTWEREQTYAGRLSAAWDATLE